MDKAGFNMPCDILLYYFFVAEAGDSAPYDITSYHVFMAEAGDSAPLQRSFKPGIGFSLLSWWTIQFNVVTDVSVYCHDGLFS